MSSLRLIPTIQTTLTAGLVMLVLAQFVPGIARSETDWTPLLDLRVRQEILDGVYHFAPETDRDWIRVRTRIGGRLEIGDHRFELRLANEHRHFITPDRELDWDEVILDQALWAWQFTETTQLVLGRQNIIWPGGFLMLEGHPLDGSRSIFHNALRVQSAPDWGRADAALIYNPKYDGLVLIDDQGRPLSDMDELGLTLRLVRGDWAGNLIYKYESDPDEKLSDLTTLTASLRHDGRVGESGNWHLDFAAQLQDGSIVVAAQAMVTGDLRTIRLEQLEHARERMLAITADSLPGTSARLEFRKGYPPLAPTDGNRRLLELYSRASEDLGYGLVAPVDPARAGAADISFCSGLVDGALCGLGLMGTGGHTVEETADLRTLASQTQRVALLIWRITRR